MIRIEKMMRGEDENEKEEGEKGKMIIMIKVFTVG